MSVQRFDFETPECVSAMHEAGVFVERGPDYIKVYSGPDMPAPMPLPSVNRLQFKLALQVFGMLASVEAFAASESATAAMKIWWAEAGLFAEDNPMLCEACDLMGISNEQKAAVFALASTMPAG